MYFILAQVSEIYFCYTYLESIIFLAGSAKRSVQGSLDTQKGIEGLFGSSHGDGRLRGSLKQIVQHLYLINYIIHFMNH